MSEFDKLQTKPRPIEIDGQEMFFRDLSIREFKEYQAICENGHSDIDAALWLVERVWVDESGELVTSDSESLTDRLSVRTLLQMATGVAKSMSTPVEDVAKN